MGFGDGIEETREGRPPRRLQFRNHLRLGLERHILSAQCYKVRPAVSPFKASLYPFKLGADHTKAAP